MTSFVHHDYPAQHPGVARAEAALDSAREIGRSLDSTKSLTAMLLAAMVAALLVVADQLIDTWADGHLLAAWVVLWTVAFAAIALFLGSARSLAVRMVSGLDAWSARLAQSRADQRLWAIAQTDPRIMAELQGAMQRAEKV